MCKNRLFKLMIMEEEDEANPKSQQWEDKEEEMGSFTNYPCIVLKALPPENLLNCGEKLGIKG